MNPRIEYKCTYVKRGTIYICLQTAPESFHKKAISQSFRILYPRDIARYLAHSSSNKWLIDYCVSVIRCIAKRLVDILTREELLK